MGAGKGNCYRQNAGFELFYFRFSYEDGRWYSEKYGYHS